MILAAALWLTAVAVDGIPLPPHATLVKWDHGRAAVLAGASSDPELILIEPGHSSQRRIPVRSAVEQARALEVLDFAIDQEGAVHAALYADLPLGRSQRLLCRFPAHGQPQCTDLGEVRCRLLAAASPGLVWCFGTGPGGMALHRVSGPREGPRFWVPAEMFGPDWTPRPGRGWLAAPSASRAWLYVAERARLYSVDLREGQMTVLPLPVLPGTHSLPSFAASDDRLAALLPLAPPAAERLDSPYGLYLHVSGRGWGRAAEGQSWMRGAVLAGMDPKAVWIWNRAARRLERVWIAPPR